jgi:hypothetical protein
MLHFVSCALLLFVAPVAFSAKILDEDRVTTAIDSRMVEEINVRIYFPLIFIK